MDFGKHCFQSRNCGCLAFKLFRTMSTQKEWISCSIHCKDFPSTVKQSQEEFLHGLSQKCSAFHGGLSHSIQIVGSLQRNLFVDLETKVLALPTGSRCHKHPSLHLRKRGLRKVYRWSTAGENIAERSRKGRNGRSTLFKILLGTSLEE